MDVTECGKMNISNIHEHLKFKTKFSGKVNFNDNPLIEIS